MCSTMFLGQLRVKDLQVFFDIENLLIMKHWTMVSTLYPLGFMKNIIILFSPN